MEMRMNKIKIKDIQNQMIKFITGITNGLKSCRCVS